MGWDELLDKVPVLSYTRVGYSLRRRVWGGEGQTGLEGRVVVVTGASSGLGLETASELASRGAVVHMVCRSRQRGEAALRQVQARAKGRGEVVLDLVDMSLQREVRAYAEAFAGRRGRLDVLINNASVLLSAREVTDEGFERTFATNTLGYYALTTLLMPLLKASAPSRVINVTSGGMYLVHMDVSDLQFERRSFDGVRAYAETKRCEVLLTEGWAREHGGDGVAFHAVHPGWADTRGVRTSLPTFRKMMAPLLRDARQGADTMIWLATRPDLHQAANGQLWFDRLARPAYQFDWTRNSPQEVARFWSLCHRATGL